MSIVNSVVMQLTHKSLSIQAIFSLQIRMANVNMSEINMGNVFAQSHGF